VMRYKSTSPVSLRHQSGVAPAPNREFGAAPAPNQPDSPVSLRHQYLNSLFQGNPGPRASTGHVRQPAGSGDEQATAANRRGSDKGITLLNQSSEPSQVEAAEIECIMGAVRRAAPRRRRDPAEWRGEYEADPELGLKAWAPIRARPQRKSRALRCQ
jgi:hypothetical protein